jgi:N-acetylglucosaminyl-diphospho-decaprenol L-rhamnosyltransferase
MIEDYVALIIGYKNKDLVVAVLNALAKQTLVPRSVIVVDNGGSFTEVDRANWQLSDISTLISRPDNPGYGAAVNLARDVVGNSALLVLTHDAVFDTTLAELLLEMLHDETVGSVGPLLHFASDRKRIFSAGGRLSKAGQASHLRAPLSENPYRVDWVDGAIVMYSRQALDAIDWLDEDYFLYFEDVDSGWRLIQAGWHSFLVPSAVAFQQPGPHPTYLGMRNMALFARKAGIPILRSFVVAISRLFRDSLSRISRGRRPEIISGIRGLYDGYSGKSVGRLN